MNEVGIPEHLGKLSSGPHGVEEISQPVDQYRVPILVDLSGYSVRAGSFPGGHHLDGLLDLVQSWREVEVLVDGHLEEAGDGLVINRGWSVEHAIEVLCPPLQDRLLVGEEGGPICTK